ncbi:hypothetical protein P152DRAFT_68557 [Eremomyces bilateralis CBS 781.70]|uniref:MULE transposase domain-containing protein n=1 Tax=Eremomyces bilateralis CBS 781.70 TaxID=1392243 RepID=A0A6G1FZV5_9PEZI|nr:uncharacterized protein P152DRAFT_68557 [Eremomyces bilateralis CBS 781.70]KAF1811308.1 hypothetical protein P152DRAFT_68557 [Eremomyces bilateralis CBS 781.70]
MKLVPGQLYPEIEFLQTVFNSGVQDTTSEVCTILKQQNSRAKTCGVDHTQGQGKLVSLPCQVLFTVFQPLDMDRTPYLVWVSSGTHSHPPPPPTRTPQQYLEQILQVIQRINNPSLTLAGLLKHPQMRAFCTQYQGTSLPDVHRSFTNLDKVSALLQKQRLLSYPLGESVAAVEHEYSKQGGKPDQYIQECFFDGENLLIACFFKEQAEALLNRESFEIDMGFQRVRESSINEIVLAAFVPELEKTFTFARIFVNGKSSLCYQKAFQALFTLISSRLEREVCWQYLHGRGFGTVVVDMELGQLEGFGQYLATLDSESRSWEWQVQNTVIFCQIHFQRSIDRAAGTSNRSTTSIHSRMGELARCRSEEDYYDLCEELMSHPESSAKVREWAKHKKRAVIASGINKYCSLIPPQLRKLPLMRAIYYALLLDQYDLKRRDNRQEYGMPHTYRNMSLSQRYQEVIRRDLDQYFRISATTTLGRRP